MVAEGPDGVAEFEAFLKTTLEPDLKRAEAARDALTSELRGYEELRNLVLQLQKDGVTTLQRMVPLGSGISMQAEVPDASRLFVKIGLGFHLDCSWDETLAVCSLRSQAHNRAIANASKRVDSISKHVALVRQGLADLAQLEAMDER